MSVQTFDINTDVVSITPAAARHLHAQLASSGSKGVRISVKESGCTGYKYVFEHVDSASDGDVSIALADGGNLFLDPKAVPFIRGTEIDYAQEGINRVLKLNNPNVTNACGCGESFTIE